MPQLDPRRSNYEVGYAIAPATGTNENGLGRESRGKESSSGDARRVRASPGIVIKAFGKIRRPDCLHEFCIGRNPRAEGFYSNLLPNGLRRSFRYCAAIGYRLFHGNLDGSMRCGSSRSEAVAVQPGEERWRTLMLRILQLLRSALGSCETKGSL